MSAIITVICRFNWGRIYFQAHSCGRWQDSALPGYWTEGLSSQGNSYQGSLLCQNEQTRRERETERDSEKERERRIKTEVIAFYNLIFV